MWIMPSFGRPEALERLLEAPGGWPENVYVLVNEDDPKAVLYEQVTNDLRDAALNGKFDMKMPWRILYVPAGSRFADAVRHAFYAKLGAPFYGIVDDDYFPITPGWHDKLVEAAGPNCIAIANNKVNFPKLYTCRVMGGELARAIGTIAPGTMRHNFSDDTWAKFADDFGLLRPLEDVIVEHRHHLFDKSVPKDATYERGSGYDFEDDRERYHAWLNSDARRLQCARVAKLLGGNATATDLSKVHLAICVPMQNMTVDFAFHRSFHNTMGLLMKKGVRCTVSEVAGGSHIGKARERALWEATRKAPDWTHLLWIDDDMGWDPKLVTRLICSDHEFCAVPGVKKIDTLSLCFNPLTDPQTFHPVTRFLEVRHVGFGFVMMKRSVIDRMCEAYPELQYDTGEGPAEWALFLDMLAQWPTKSGRPERLSEDFSFCERWTAIGGEIWIDPDAALVHAGRKEYTGKASDTFGRYRALPAEEGPADAA